MHVEVLEVGAGAGAGANGVKGMLADELRDSVGSAELLRDNVGVSNSL
jgi:hypothetical protein